MKKTDIKTIDYRKAYRFRRQYPEQKERLSKINNQYLQKAIELIGTTKAQLN